MLKPSSIRKIWIAALACFAWHAGAVAQEQRSEVQLRVIEPSRGDRPSHPPPAVVWLKPMGGQTPVFPTHERYVLLQKNRMFEPHLIVVPVGSVVLFPNADPFFHNVFSLFDGKRFDLGLYEAGTSKEVTFSREGLSYIFCNIHPEMSAVVIALSTPFYAIVNPYGKTTLHDVPAGEYELHIWVEGEPQPALDRLTRRVHVSSSKTDLGDATLVTPPNHDARHENKFGRPYEPSEEPVY